MAGVPCSPLARKVNILSPPLLDDEVLTWNTAQFAFLNMDNQREIAWPQRAIPSKLLRALIIASATAHGLVHIPCTQCSTV